MTKINSDKNIIYIKTKPQTDLRLEKFYQLLGLQLASIVKFLPVSPNSVTLSKIPLGLLIFQLLYSQSFTASALAIILYKILDKLDGALARITKKTSVFGAWLDLLIDRIVWGLILFGVAIASARINQNELPYLLLALAFFLNILFQNLTFLNKKQKLNWSVKKTFIKSKFKLAKFDLAFELIFSFYYLFDQFLALALFLQNPVKLIFNFNLIFIVLIAYNLFFLFATSFVIFSQARTSRK